MKNLNFVALSLMILLTSCSKTVDFDQIISNKIPFVVQITYKSDRAMSGETVSSEIEPNTEDYNRIIEWLQQNSTGWKTTIAFYEKENKLKQNNFELYYMGYYVAIHFKDKEGEKHSYGKIVEEGSLDFLFD